MALATDDVVTSFRADTTDLERGTARASEAFGRSTQMMARDVMGLGRSMASFTQVGGNMSDKIGGLVFDLSQLSESAGKVSTSFGSALAVISRAAPWLALASAIGTAIFALADYGKEAKKAEKSTEDLQKEITEAADNLRLIQSLTGGPADVSSALRLSRRAEGGRQGVISAAEFERQFGGFVPEETKKGPGKVAQDIDLATLSMERFRGEMDLLEENVRPLVGVTTAISTMASSIDLSASIMAASIANLGNVARAAGEGGLRSFFSTLYGGKGAAAAFRAMIGSMIQSLGVEAGVQTVVELARGFAALAAFSPAAAGHFQSAALWGSAAVMAGAVAGAMGGGGVGGGIGGSKGRLPRSPREDEKTPLGEKRETQPIIIRVEVPPGGEAVAGQGVISAVEAYERERGRRTFAREA